MKKEMLYYYLDKINNKVYIKCKIICIVKYIIHNKSFRFNTTMCIICNEDLYEVQLNWKDTLNTLVSITTAIQTTTVEAVTRLVDTVNYFSTRQNMILYNKSSTLNCYYLFNLYILGFFMHNLFVSSCHFYFPIQGGEYCSKLLIF